MFEDPSFPVQSAFIVDSAKLKVVLCTLSQVLILERGHELLQAVNGLRAGVQKTRCSQAPHHLSGFGSSTICTGLGGFDIARQDAKAEALHDRGSVEEDVARGDDSPDHRHTASPAPSDPEVGFDS